MPTPGLFFLRVRIISPKLSDEALNLWFDKGFVPDVLRAGLGNLAVLYKNTDPNAKYQYCITFRTPQIESAFDPMTHFAKIPAQSQLLPENGN
jgi:hypothetical protein